MSRRYVVLEPAGPNDGGEPFARLSDRAVFVLDGFTWSAFLVPWLWLIGFGLFVSGLLALLAWIGLGWLIHLGHSGLALALGLLLAVLVGLEGPAWRIAHLRRRGYTDRGTVAAASEAEAAVLYYATSDLARLPRGRLLAASAPWSFAPRPPAPARRWWQFRRRDERARA